MNVSRVPWSTVRSVAALSLAAGITVGAPWWGPRFLAGMAFFRVRAVEVDGARYTSPADVVDRLHVDTTASVWDDHRVLESRVRGLPQVRTVAIGRKLPGTLVVRVTERLPVALGPARATNGGGAASGSEGARVPDAGLGLRAYDADGAMLPIDPTRVDVDLPIVTGRDVATFRLLGQVRDDLPALFARISEVRRTPAGELLISLGDTRVRAPADVDVTRLAMVLPVVADLAQRRVPAAELDLRYRDQVVARLQ